MDTTDTEAGTGSLPTADGAVASPETIRAINEAVAAAFAKFQPSQAIDLASITDRIGALEASNEASPVWTILERIDGITAILGAMRQVIVAQFPHDAGSLARAFGDVASRAAVPSLRATTGYEFLPPTARPGTAPADRRAPMGQGQFRAGLGAGIFRAGADLAAIPTRGQVKRAAAEALAAPVVAAKA